MSNATVTGLNKPIGEGRPEAGSEEPRPRAVGSPLPIGSGSPSAPAGQGEQQRVFAAPPAGRTLANSASAPPVQAPSGMQRAVGALRAALPFVQRILPLLDGNIGTAVSNILTPHHHAPPPPPPVNLAPIQDSLAELQTQHVELRNQVTEQNSSLKRVEDQLEQVREATDRNTLEQQELVEDLKGVGNRVNLFALIALGLLAVSVAINVVLYLHIVRVLP
ncbi:MAG TPA: hypothetical protein VGG56_13890 [Terracidiphilus sp.]|jgi:hypothetical protein